MSLSGIQLFQILKTRLGEKEAEELVSFVETKVKAEFENSKQILATKEDILGTKEDIANVKSDLLKSIYVVGLIQFLEIVGSVLAIVNFMLK